MSESETESETQTGGRAGPEDPQAYIAAGDGRDRRGGAAAPGLGRPAAPARARARRALLGPLADRRARGRPERGAAPGRRGHLHRPGGPGGVGAGGRRLRQEGHALALHVVRRVGHPPDEPVGLRGEPGPAHRRRPAQGAGAGGGGAEGARGRRGRVRRAGRTRQLVGRAGAGGVEQGAGPGAARGLR